MTATPTQMLVDYLRSYDACYSVPMIGEAAERIAAQDIQIASLREEVARLDRILTVDVKLEPATYVRAGCKIRTVVAGLSAPYRSKEPVDAAIGKSDKEQA